VKACVVDCSVALKWYIPEPHAESAGQLLDGSHELHAPDLLLPEFGNCLWKKVRLGELTENETRSVLRALAKVPLEIHSSELLVEAALEIALHAARTVYDSLYVALSILLDCPFVTADQRLLSALRASCPSAEVHYIAQY
jgi:predicted nucleic acid-binding protein